MTKTKRIILTTLVLLTGFFSNIIFPGTLQAHIESITDKTLLGQALWHLIPVVIILVVFHKFSHLPRELGLNRGFLKGLLYAFLFTLPILIGLAIIGHINPQQPVTMLLAKTFKEGFTEEVFFRAFLFGQLFRHCKWGFIPAAIVGGIIFGTGHLYQGDTLAGSLGAFGITFMGAAWFSWLFAEWEFNLWLPITMHFLMNFYWGFFNISNGASGSLLANIPRVITIFLSIYVTLKLARKKKLQLVINRTNLLIQRSNTDYAAHS